MLQRTFIHIPGIGRTKEEFLWRNNITSWDDFLDNGHTVGISETTKEYIRKNLEISKEQLKRQNHAYFSETLPYNEHWRVYRDFRNSVFLDIETTGLSRDRNKITLIGLYDGKKSRIFTRHKDMDEFPDEIKRYSTLITFNGRRFDIPFIRAKFPGIRINQFHIDLCFLMRELGYSGGLKSIERQIGLKREDDIADIDGYEAVRLWYRYRKGDNEALKTLTEYNKADIKNLKVLMDLAFDKKKESMNHLDKK